MIKNTQKFCAIDRGMISSQVELIKRATGTTDYHLGVWFTVPATIRRANLQLRHRDAVTDVISLPLQQCAAPGQPPPPLALEEAEDGEAQRHYALGTILLCPQHVAQEHPGDALRRPHDALHLRCVELIAHSVCHLLGHTHDADDDHAAMQRMERGIYAYLLRHHPAHPAYTRYFEQLLA